MVAAVNTTPAEPNAYQLWQRARSAVTSVQYPRRIAYAIAITGLDGETPVSDHYRGACDPDDDLVRVLPISDEQFAAPAPIPHGVNAKFSIGLCFGVPICRAIQLPLGHPAPYQDLLGIPLLMPTYMFGIRYETSTGSTAQDNNERLRVIATVSAQALKYRVSLIDEPVLDGVPTYHLELIPLQRPKENRLRELWIGTTDDLPRRASIAGNFTTAPLVDVPWTVDFSVIDGAPYVTRESTADTLYLPHRRVVRNAVIAFQDIHEPTSFYDTPLVEPDPTDAPLVEPRP